MFNAEEVAGEVDGRRRSSPGQEHGDLRDAHPRRHAGDGGLSGQAQGQGLHRVGAGRISLRNQVLLR